MQPPRPREVPTLASDHTALKSRLLTVPVVKEVTETGQCDRREEFPGSTSFGEGGNDAAGKIRRYPRRISRMPQLCPSDPAVSLPTRGWGLPRGLSFPRQSPCLPSPAPRDSRSPQPRQRWDAGHRQPQRWRQRLRSGCCVPGTSQARSHLTLTITGRACNYTHLKNCDRKTPHNIKLPPSLFSHVQFSRACSHTHRTFTLL